MWSTVKEFILFLYVCVFFYFVITSMSNPDNNSKAIFWVYLKFRCNWPLTTIEGKFSISLCSETQKLFLKKKQKYRVNVKVHLESESEVYSSCNIQIYKIIRNVKMQPADKISLMCTKDQDYDRLFLHNFWGKCF